MKKIFWRVWWGGMITIVVVLALATNGKPLQPEPIKWAESLRPEYPFCVSEETFNEMTGAIAANDTNQISYLFNHGCFTGVPNLKFSVIDAGFGTAKVRIYMKLEDADSFIAWTNREAIKP